MGWSCGALAGDAMRRLSDASVRRHGSSNALADGFWETSRTEHKDGAITGTVWRNVPAPEGKTGQYVRKAGSFRIEPDGRLSRGTAEMRAMILEPRTVYPGLTATT